MKSGPVTLALFAAVVPVLRKYWIRDELTPFAGSAPSCGEFTPRAFAVLEGGVEVRVRYVVGQKTHADR
jgi:hypothetical protein